MKRSLSQLVAGERFPHPEHPDSQEAYDLYILANGPWTVARFMVEPPRIVAARKWIEFARLLAPTATQDLDHVREQLDDASKDLSTRTQDAQQALARSRIYRARLRVADATRQRLEVRSLLFLDEDD